MLSKNYIIRPKDTLCAAILLAVVILFFVPGFAHAWPSEADWIPLINSSGYVGDPDSDYTQCHLDIVGDSTHPAVMIYNDGDYIYYRIRLDCDPRQSGYMKANTWGLLVDTDLNADSYEWMARIDGRPVDSIVISQNTSQGTLGDPSDSAEVDVWTEPLDNTPGSENFKVTVAGTDFPLGSPDTDYWLEYRYPYDVWLYYMGLDENSVIRYFVGTGPSGWTLAGDIVGTSLYTDLSSPLLPSGTTPATGYVMFVSGLDGNGDVTTAYPGQTLYIKVEDQDQDSQKTQAETLTVLVSTPGGDSETVTLTEIGISNGIFTGSLSTVDGGAVPGNGILELSPIETVLVTYLDAVDASLNKGRNRYDSLTAMPSADVAVSIGVNNSTPNEGDVISYTITLTNNGQSDASGLQITDLLPSGLVYNSNSGGGLYNPSSGIWTVASLLDSQVKQLVINATVDTGTAGQTIENFASITFNPQLDPVSSNDSDSVSITVQGSDLELVKSVDNDTPSEGATVVFTLTLTNKGTNDATGIIVNDVLPSGVTYSLSSPSVGSYSPATGLWDGFGLLNGEAATLDITATVDALTSGQIVTNFANIVYADQSDPVLSNNSSSSSIAVAGVNLALTKSVDVPYPDVAQIVTFTLTIINNSTNAADNVEVLDLLPSGLTYSSDNPSSGSYDQSTGLWDGFSLAAGATATLDISATVDPGTGGSTITNNALVNGVTQTELDPADDSSSASVTVKAADIAVSKSVDDPSPDPSAEVAFTITVTNNGPYAATGIELTDTLSGGLVYVSNTPSAGSYNSATGLWSGLSLAVGASETLVINATVPATSGAVETNSIAVTASDQEDPVALNNTASAGVTVGGVDLEVIKTVDNPSPGEGDTVVYTITVNNIGDFPATGIEVLDSLPSGISHVSDSATQGTYNQSSGLWKTLSITNGASATLTITVTVDAGTNGDTIENTARMISVTQADIDITNNIDKATIYVGSTDLAISKSVDNPTPTEGDTLSYTVTVTNNGPNPATGVTVTDLLPSDITYLIDNAGGYYDSATGIWNVTNAGSPTLAAGASVALVVNATVNASTGGQTIINYAEITASDQLDQDNSNDLSSVSIIVQNADISILKVGDNSTPDEQSTVSFTLLVTNNGPHDATGIVVQDVLPSGLTYAADDGGGNYDSSTGIWSVGALTKLSSATLVINATVDIGTGGSTITNIANIVSSDQADSVPANNTSSFSLSPVSIAFPDLRMSKTVLSFWDPVNLSSGNQKSIPGAVMQYTIRVSNEGDGSPDTDTVVIEDTLPPEVEMLVAGAAVIFVNGTVDSGLSFSYGGVGDPGDSVEFADSGGYGYTPDDTLPGGYDPSVRKIRITMGGDFKVSDGTSHPYFNITFKVRLK